MTKKKAKRKTKKAAKKVTKMPMDVVFEPDEDMELAVKFGPEVLESVPDEVAANYDPEPEAPATRAAKDRSEVYGGKGRGGNG